MEKNPENERGDLAQSVDEPRDRRVEDAARGLRKKGIELHEYLSKVHAEVEEWKFGVEESPDGFRVEWRVVALIRRPEK